MFGTPQRGENAKSRGEKRVKNDFEHKKGRQMLSAAQKTII